MSQAMAEISHNVPHRSRDTREISPDQSRQASGSERGAGAKIEAGLCVRGPRARFSVIFLV
jgi:hypothetical protein